MGYNFILTHSKEVAQPKYALNLHLIYTKKCKLSIEYSAFFGALVLMLLTNFFNFKWDQYMNLVPTREPTPDLGYNMRSI